MPSLSTHYPSSLTPRDLVLGIDGGGSQTRALLAPAREASDDMAGEVIGSGCGGPSNLQAVGQERAIQSLEQAIEQAFSTAGRRRQPVAAVCMGLAGADRPDDRAMLTQWATANHLTERVRIENDGALVLAAGTPDGWGLGVIAGTGSFALARTTDGRVCRSGGWGYLLGDEGSGYAVALAGLRAIARAADGRGPATALSSRFLARLRVNKVEALIPTLYSAEFTRADLAALASVVTDPALSGDPVAQNILDTAAEELADVAVAAARILLENASAAVPLALAGSLLLASAPFQDRLVTGLRRRGVSPDPIRHVCTPALGAIRLAREMLS